MNISTNYSMPKVSFGDLIIDGGYCNCRPSNKLSSNEYKEILIEDPEDEVIQSHLQAISDRNKAILEMRQDAQDFYNDIHGINRQPKSAFVSACFFEDNGFEPVYEEEVEEVPAKQNKISKFFNKINPFKK